MSTSKYTTSHVAKLSAPYDRTKLQRNGHSIPWPSMGLIYYSQQKNKLHWFFKIPKLWGWANKVCRRFELIFKAFIQSGALDANRRRLSIWLVYCRHYFSADILLLQFMICDKDVVSSAKLYHVILDILYYFNVLHIYQMYGQLL